MLIKVKRLHSSAIIPYYSRPGDAAMDLYATGVDYDDYGNLVCHTGLAMEIPEGHVGLLFPRSSISKTPLSLRNSVGVVDSGYRGEIMLKFDREDRVLNPEETIYKVGDRVGQIMIMPYPKVQFFEAQELSSTERGDGGFGSTGA
jgi:dUTP pyrophosphatase